MTTPRIRSLVSLAAVLTISLTLGGCASAPARPATDLSAPSDEPPRAIQFENEARDYVHVYLVNAQRQWLLGRVESWSRATLRIPESALDGSPLPMWLAVLTGEKISLRVTSEPRAATTIPLRTADILSQQWTFSHALANGHLMGAPLGRAPVEVNLP